MYPRSRRDGLAVEEAGQSFVGGRGIAEGAGGDVDSAEEVLIKLAVNTKAGANAGSIAIGNALLEEVLTTDAHVAGEAEPSEGGLKRRQPSFADPVQRQRCC